MPGQLEFQVGPTEGIQAADDLWMARYILYRISEDFDVSVTLDPKLFPNWSGSGCHCNFTTEEMRQENGLGYIMEAIKKLEEKHELHMEIYGEGNLSRLIGNPNLGTSTFQDFSYGVGDRGASIRINTQIVREGKGYFEDRRPGSNADPYLVTGAVADTVILDGSQLEGMVEHYRKWKEWKLQ